MAGIGWWRWGTGGVLLGENRLKQIFKINFVVSIMFWLHRVSVAAYRLPLIVVYGIFTAVASLVSEHRL